MTATHLCCSSSHTELLYLCTCTLVPITFVFKQRALQNSLALVYLTQKFTRIFKEMCLKTPFVNRYNFVFITSILGMQFLGSSRVFLLGIFCSYNFRLASLILMTLGSICRLYVSITIDMPNTERMFCFEIFSTRC